ncbi:hypothetical protein MZM54_03180 [[Brevibacterium] frigoritolerans]|nr:hypothetical protein [Peribacillus frigoritolerans]
MNFRQPNPPKNVNWIPMIIYKNGEEIAEFEHLQEAFRYFRPLLSVTDKEIYNFLTLGVFEFLSYRINNDNYDFRTYEERRRRHFFEIALNKETGRKSRKSSYS